MTGARGFFARLRVVVLSDAQLNDLAEHVAERLR